MIYEKGIKCPYCGHIQDTFDFLQYLYAKGIDSDGITCKKCGGVFNAFLGTKNEPNYKIKNKK